MNSSEFIKISNKNSDIRCKQGKSITTTVVIEGKKYFKKQLKDGHQNDLRHRMAIYKEFDVGRQIDSPYIVKYTGINEDEKGVYVLMEHINGMNIAEKMEAEPNYFHNPRNTEKMLKQLASALKALHKQNIAYLDLKPENVMLTQISNDLKLTDLGGCFTDSNDYTAERTKEYAAPELVEDQIDKVDARTDIYGIGKLLQYIENKTQTKLPKHLSRIKERCLHADKTKRYETVDEIIKVLNKKKRIIRYAFYSSFLLLLLGGIMGWQWFTTTESYRLLDLRLKSDAIIEGIYYKKISEEEGTCKVIGLSDWNNLYIRDKVEIDGKSYTTTEIADSVFKGCIHMESVNLPHGLRKIGKEAFFDCQKLVTVTLPEGFTTLEHACFKGTGIRNVSFPKSLKSIAHASFAQCRNIKDLVIPEGVETLELDAFANCTNLVNVELPSSLKTICRGVFWDCQSLQEISIPAGVNTIGEYAFFYCKNLRHVYNHSLEPQPLSVIFNHKDITLHVPAASVEKYRKAKHWKEFTIVGDL